MDRIVDIEIAVASKRIGLHGCRGYNGFIRIGDMQESIYCPVVTWSIREYKKQWKDALERLKNHTTSCLITGFVIKNGEPELEWWPMYKIENKIYVQNQWLWGENYKERIGDKPFTPDTCYDFVQPRKTFTEEGEKISEWSVPYCED